MDRLDLPTNERMRARADGREKRMTWDGVEKVSLAASAGLLAASAAIGFRWVASPYIKGYASAGASFYVLSRVAAHRGSLATGA